MRSEPAPRAKRTQRLCALPEHPAEKLRVAVHPGCIACSTYNPLGLQLKFEYEAGGCVSCRFDRGRDFPGAPDRLHEGVTGTLLQSTMTHCLFARGVVGDIEKLSIRYLESVDTDPELRVRARISHIRQGSYDVEAELVQDGRCRALARGSFTTR